MAGSSGRTSFIPSVQTPSGASLADKPSETRATPPSRRWSGASPLKGVGRPTDAKREPERLPDPRVLSTRHAAVATSRRADLVAGSAGQQAGEGSAFTRASDALSRELHAIDALFVATPHGSPLPEFNPQAIAAATDLIHAAAKNEADVEQFGAAVSGALQAMAAASVNMPARNYWTFNEGLAAIAGAAAKGLASEQRLVLGYVFAAHGFAPAITIAGGDDPAQQDLSRGVRLAQTPVAELDTLPEGSPAQSEMLHCLTRIPAPKQSSVHTAIEALDFGRPSAQVRASMVDFALVQRAKGGVDRDHEQQLFWSIAAHDAGFAHRDALAWNALAVLPDGAGVDTFNASDAMARFHLNYQRSAPVVWGQPDWLGGQLAALQEARGNSSLAKETLGQLRSGARALLVQCACLQRHLVEAPSPAACRVVGLVAGEVRKAAQVLQEAAAILATKEGIQAVGRASQKDLALTIEALDTVIGTANDRQSGGR